MRQYSKVSAAAMEVLVLVLLGLVCVSLQTPTDERIALKEESQSGDTSSLLTIEDDPLAGLDDAADKRAHVFRYGKRAPSVFRYGKRAPSVFRYGKRLFDDGGADSSLFPKRIFRYGKRGHASEPGRGWELMLPRGEEGGVRGVAEGEEEETLLIKGSDDIDAITVDKKPIFRYG